MHVRCPHCHNPLELVDDAEFSDIQCPSCGSSFSLLEETISHSAGVGQVIVDFCVHGFKLSKLLLLPRDADLYASRDIVSFRAMPNMRPTSLHSLLNDDDMQDPDSVVAVPTWRPFRMVHFSTSICRNNR